MNHHVITARGRLFAVVCVVSGWKTRRLPIPIPLLQHIVTQVVVGVKRRLESLLEEIIGSHITFYMVDEMIREVLLAHIGEWVNGKVALMGETGT